VPSRAIHLAKAESNEQLSLELLNGPTLDWSATVLFYAALHLIEATLAPQAHTQSHVERDRRIRQHPQLRAIYFSYRDLKLFSLKARYDCHVFTVSDVQRLHAVEYQALKNHLRPILGFTF